MDFTGAIINEFNSLPKFWWLWLILTAVGTCVVLRMIGKREKSVAIALLASYILFILFETVIGRSPGDFRLELIPFWSYGRPDLRSEVIMNYLLFIPLGILLCCCMRRCFWCVSVGFGITVCIELYQLFTRTGLFELDDIIGNTVGCLIGVGIWKVALRRRT